MSEQHRRFVRDAAIALASVAACNALIAFVGVGRLTTANRVLLFGRLMLGPLGAWPNVPARDVLASLPLLVPVHLLALVPLGLFVWKRSGLALFWAAVAWVATGYLVSIAVWI